MTQISDNSLMDEVQEWFEDDSISFEELVNRLDQLPGSIPVDVVFDENMQVIIVP
jgi:hypothetical protein